MEPKSKAYYAFFAVLLVWVIGGVVYHFLENWTWVDSFYFAAVTMTTVGYGDHYPTTVTSKLFTIVYLFSGIGVVLYAFSVAGKYYVDKRFRSFFETRRRRRK